MASEETLRSYEAAGLVSAAPHFGSHPVVLMVDMCQAYFTAGSPLDLAQPEVVDACSQLVEAARSAGVPVMWTRVEFEPGGDNGVWYDRLGVLQAFDRGNALGDWVPGLEPKPTDTVVTKQHASGFFGTDLDAHLGSAGADSILIGGVSTSGCVRATATDCSAYGFPPLVVAEAVGDRTTEVQTANLFDLAAKYADVISLSQAVHHLGELESA
jgi:maleamate amidohydrolase